MRLWILADCRDFARYEEGSASVFSHNSMTTFVWVRSIVPGWVTLLGIAFLVERPLLDWMAPLFEVIWIATVHLAFDGLTLAAAGWVTGRFHRSHAILSAIVFAATLCFWDFGETLALRVPWLVRLAWDSFHDSRFLDSLIASLETHALLLACLIAGAALSRPRERPIELNVR